MLGASVDEAASGLGSHPRVPREPAHGGQAESHQQRMTRLGNRIRGLFEEAGTDLDLPELKDVVSEEIAEL